MYVGQRREEEEEERAIYVCMYELLIYTHLPYFPNRSNRIQRGFFLIDRF